MKLDSGYRCETCESKRSVDLWVIVSPSGKRTEQILCLAHAVEVEESGNTVNSAIGLELERRERMARQA